MALVSGYSSDEDDRVNASSNPFGIADADEHPAKRMKLDGPSLKVVAAPDVLAEDPLHQTSLVARPTDTQMLVNITHEDMLKPIVGPENPFSDKKVVQNQNLLSGHVEELVMDEDAFRQQHLTHAILGYSVNPSEDPNAAPVVGSLEAGQKKQLCHPIHAPPDKGRASGEEEKTR